MHVLDPVELAVSYFLFGLFIVGPSITFIAAVAYMLYNKLKGA